MKKPDPTIRVPGSHDTPQRVASTFASRMGKRQGKIAALMTEIVKAFMEGGQYANYMAQSHTGVEFQRLKPTLRTEAQQNWSKDQLPLIEINVEDMTEEDVDLDPGVELNAKLQRVFQRIAGYMPVTFTIVGRSESETGLCKWAIEQIFSRYIRRIYRGVILNQAQNWQVCIPKDIEFSDVPANEYPQNALGGDETWLTVQVRFSIYYESLHVENRVKPHVSVVKKEIPLTLIAESPTDQVYIGERCSFLIHKEGLPVASFYLNDPNLGRISLSEDQTRIMVLPLQEGKATLTVKTDREQASINFEIIK